VGPGFVETLTEFESEPPSESRKFDVVLFALKLLAILTVPPAPSLSGPSALA